MQDNGLPASPGDPRAEELIVEIYRQLTERTGSGDDPSVVVLSRRDYDILQRYRDRLGELGPGDYLERYRIFDLEFFVDDVQQPEVRGRVPGT